MAKSVEAGGPRKGKPMITKKLGGEVTIVPAGMAKEILKKAVASALAKRAASGQSSKEIIKAVLNSKQVQKIQPTQQDVAKELYNFYKRNPKYDLTVKVTKKAPQTKEDIAKAKAIAASQAKKARIEAGISVKQAKPKVTNKGKVTEKGKAAAIARNTETKRQAAIDAKNTPQRQGQTIRGKFYPEPRPGYAGREIPGKSIDAREPNVNSAFEELSKRELAMYQEATRRVEQGLKNSGKRMKPDMPKPKPKTKLPSADARLREASKKLTPAQLQKIKAIVAETRRRAGA